MRNAKEFAVTMLTTLFVSLAGVFSLLASDNRPIGVFDSGTGGLTVLEKMLTDEYAHERFVYFGDQANMPYGDYAAAGKSDFLRGLVIRDAEFLLGKDAKIIVIACNTATAYGYDAVADLLRRRGDGTRVIGVVNAGARSAIRQLDLVRHPQPCAIGVMATPGTIASGVYERTIKSELAKLGVKCEVRVFSRGCAGLADAVEAGSKDAPKIACDNLKVILDEHRQTAPSLPLRAVILGCTHFPFVQRELEAVAPKDLVFVDPAVDTAVECKAALLEQNRLTDAKTPISVDTYVSVPAPGLDSSKLDRNGGLTREWKYGRDNPATDRSTVPVTILEATKGDPLKFIPFAHMIPRVSRQLAAPCHIWLEAEAFSDSGGWRVDTQFVHKMGSAYLLAVGVGKPVDAASTTVSVPRAGVWHAWVRTKDWEPSHSPGRFRLEIGGKSSPDLGCSGKSGWRWERAGDYRLPLGDATVRLVDVSGYFARCDAVLLTTDGAYRPPEDLQSLETERLRLSGRPVEIEDAGTFDVVVVGAGTTGMGAAVASARARARTALVHDRKVLGGNASSEIGVAIHGAAHAHPNMRETGLIEEAKLLRADIQHRTGRHASISEAYRAQAKAEKNLKVCLNNRVIRVEKSAKGHLTAVVAVDTLTGVRRRYRAKMFVDCTGDGWIGYYAGVPYRYGREGRDEFGEKEAPESPDKTTMSGVIFDNGLWSLAFRDAGHPVEYVTPAWADVLPKDWTRKLKPVIRARGGFTSAWWIEHSGDINDFEDPEGARDELIKISFAYFGWGKNKWEHRALLENCELSAVGFIDGRRETLRLMGDYILTGEDQKKATVFPDRISYGGWPMDTHDPLGMMNPHGNGYWRVHPWLPIYTIPYRILYNPGFDNLFFAGRCSSVSHMGLGSVRVESTLAALGQVCGTAAALCAASGESPKSFGERHMNEFQQRLLKDDLYIPQIANEDSEDIARKAMVTASSSQDRLTFAMSPSVQWNVSKSKIGFRCPRVEGERDLCYASGASPSAVIDGVSRVERDVAHAWVSDASQSLPQTLTLTWKDPVEIGEVRLTFDTNLMPAQPEVMPKSMVKGYRLEGLGADGKWTVLASEKNNVRRHAIHRFSNRWLSALRVVCVETWGDPSARIYEVRAYRSATSSRPIVSPKRFCYNVPK